VATLNRKEREEIAARRIVRVLQAQTVANLRTLEQKIADAGPSPLRVDPHILTPVKASLIKSGRLVQVDQANAQWLHLDDENPEKVAARLATLKGIWAEFVSQKVSRRTGQALEIGVFRAILAADGVMPFGGFLDLDTHDDDKLFSKNEIHTLNGRSLGKLALDFIVAAGGDHCGVEVKNTRPWFYPHDQELKDAIRKARTLDVVPVLVARRIHFTVFKVLGACGVILHQTFNQLMAKADTDLADKAREKTLLGYHDIRVSNAADARLSRFFSVNLPPLVGPARQKLADYGDLLDAYVTNEMAYDEFAGRVRRRQQGLPEDGDWPDDGTQAEIDFD